MASCISDTHQLPLRSIHSIELALASHDLSTLTSLIHSTRRGCQGQIIQDVERIPRRRCVSWLPCDGFSWQRGTDLRLPADFSHLGSIFILLHKMIDLSVSEFRTDQTRSHSAHTNDRPRAARASLSSHKPSISWSTSQDILVRGDETRHPRLQRLTRPGTDLFQTNSLYNLLFKIAFIGAQGYIIYLMTTAYKPTNDPNVDTFRVQYLLGGAAVLAILLPYKYTLSEILWAFSIWLESVAIMPQLFMLQRTGEAETITTHYLFALGLYRALYIPNWIYRYFAEEGHKVDWIAVVAGLVQTVMYSDFFWVYYNKVLKGKKFKLPV